MSAIRSIAARFTQEKQLAVFKDKVETSGVILFLQPDRLRWEICKPFRSILVVDGDEVGKFEYVKDQRRVVNLQAGRDAVLLVMAQIRSWLRGKFDQQNDLYDLKVVEEPHPTVFLATRDETLRKSVEAIEVQLTDDLAAVSSVTILERRGDRTWMRFSDLRRDATLPVDLFSASDPRELDLKAIEEAPPLPGATGR